MKKQVVTHRSLHEPDSTVRAARENLALVGKSTTMRRSPKLLFVSYHFPPSRSIACVRTWNIAKYLVKVGWEVTVVTPNLSFVSDANNATLIEVDLQQTGVRRILTGHGWRILLPNYRKGPFLSIASRISRRVAWQLGIEESVGWMRAAQVACCSLNSNDVDVIMATGPPFDSFRLAKRLAHSLQRPYVLDYRDPWTGNPHTKRRHGLKNVRREQELLEDSAAVTIVSPSWRSALESRFELDSKPHVLTNGFDPEDLAVVKPYDFGHFAIVYTGIFYPPKRVITPVIAALRKLKWLTEKEVPPWRFHYYGPHEAHVCQEATRFDVMDRVVLHGQVSRAMALSAVHGAGVAVVITSTADRGTQDDRGVVPGKVFDALGLGTPILLIAPQNNDSREIANENSMEGSFTGGDVDGIAQFLSKTMRAKRTKANCSTGKHSWPVLAHQLNTILRDVIG